MSERYGTLDDMPGLLFGLEDFLDTAIDKAIADLKANVHPLYNSGRIVAFKEVLDYIVVNRHG